MTDCGHLPAGPYTLCDQCYRATLVLLQDTVSAYEDLDPHSRTMILDGGGSGPNKPKSKSPGNDDVIALRDPRTPGTLPHLLVETMGLLGAPNFRTVTGNARAIVTRFRMVATAPWGPWFLSKLRRVRETLERATDGPRATVGTCECGSRLFAPSEGYEVACGGCGASYDLTGHVERLLGAQAL